MAFFEQIEHLVLLSIIQGALIFLLNLQGGFGNAEKVQGGCVVLMCFLAFRGAFKIPMEIQGDTKNYLNFSGGLFYCQNLFRGA